MRSILLALALLAAPAAVQAQAAAPPETCVAKDADLPPELAAWRDRAPLAAARGRSRPTGGQTGSNGLTRAQTGSNGLSRGHLEDLVLSK